MSDKTLLDLLGTFHSARVLVLGDVMLDRFVYGIGRAHLARGADSGHDASSARVDMLGGAANVARNVATLGGQAILVGVVGEDATAEHMRAQLALIPTDPGRN